MKSAYVLGAVIVIILIGAGFFFLHAKPQTASGPAVPAAASSTPDAAGAATASSSSPSAAPAPEHFTVNGNDATADLKIITVAKGTPVTITFGADAGSTYHGGLDFRSSVVNTGTIAPGSTKSVTFTADSSFAFTPYWPATNIAKPYVISVNVR